MERNQEHTERGRRQLAYMWLAGVVWVFISLGAGPLVATGGEAQWEVVARGETSVVVDHQPHPFAGFASDTLFLSPFEQPVWQRIADDFTLSQTSPISEIRWWGFYDQDNPPTSETFRIRVYGSLSSNGLPDESNTILETFIVNPSRILTGRQIAVGVEPDEYFFTASLPQPVVLAGQTQHWLEITQIEDLSTAFRWESSLADMNGLAFLNNNVENWTLTTNVLADTAFQLVVVPEPSTLLFSCFVVMLLCRRNCREL